MHAHREESEREKLLRVNATAAESRNRLRQFKEEQARSAAELRKRMLTSMSGGELRVRSELGEIDEARRHRLEQEIRELDMQAAQQAEIYREQRATRELWEGLRNRHFSVYQQRQQLRDQKQAEDDFLLTRQNLPGVGRQS